MTLPRRDRHALATAVRRSRRRQRHSNSNAIATLRCRSGDAGEPCASTAWDGPRDPLPSSQISGPRGRTMTMMQDARELEWEARPEPVNPFAGGALTGEDTPAEAIGYTPWKKSST